MDTSKLVVGQEVYMASGWCPRASEPYAIFVDKGKVTKITSNGVEATIFWHPRVRHFDRYGIGAEYEGNYEWGVWELTDDEGVIQDCEEEIARKEFACKELVTEEARLLWARIQGTPRAVWSIDWWLDDDTKLDMLRKLNCGVPFIMFEKEDFEADSYYPTKEGLVRAKARWNAVTDKMIAAFEASHRMRSLTCEERSCEASKRSAKRDEQIWKEGMSLFVEYHSLLWA